jgi:hypothetical protein
MEASPAPIADTAYDNAGINRAETEILEGFGFPSVDNIEIVTCLSSCNSHCNGSASFAAKSGSFEKANGVTNTVATFSRAPFMIVSSEGSQTEGRFSLQVT